MVLRENTFLCLNFHIFHIFCRYDDITSNLGGGGSFRAPRKHIRSNSCDVKITRSNSKESDTNDYRSKRFIKTHSRNNSRDYENEYQYSKIFNNDNNNTNNNMNIKYILNHLKPTNALNNANAEHQNIFNNMRNNQKNRRHIRNHSYGQEFTFLPNNAIIRLDNDIANKFLANSSSNLASNFSRSHSRKNSKDFGDLSLLKNCNQTNRKLLNRGNSSELTEEFDEKFEKTSNTSTDNVPGVSSADLGETSQNLQAILSEEAANCLRHRRTNSKDLNRSPATQQLPLVATTTATSSAVAAENQHREAAQILLRRKQSDDDFTNA
jgi:solute carrier organic anion transporter family, member 3A